MSEKKISLNIPKNLLADIDDLRKREIPKLNRTQMIIKILSKYIFTYNKKDKENDKTL